MPENPTDLLDAQAARLKKPSTTRCAPATRDQTSLDEAEAAFEATLKVFTRESQPMQWAFEQNNLGDVHWNRGSYGGGNAEFQRAIEFFENAKQGFTEAGYTLPIPLTDRKIDLVKKQIAKK
ncbi:hypothetical protein NKG60_02555 [Mesorhizobium sp. M1428]|uniref:hypothetical protein n=1 Tax=unclassified Mesorhizobium TaxID=325217 RepID=UPI00333623A0